MNETDQFYQTFDTMSEFSIRDLLSSDRIDWNALAVRSLLSQTFIQRFHTYLDMRLICSHQSLTDETLDILYPHIDWFVYLKFNKITRQQYEKYKDYIRLFQ